MTILLDESSRRTKLFPAPGGPITLYLSSMRWTGRRFVEDAQDDDVRPSSIFQRVVFRIPDPIEPLLYSRLILSSTGKFQLRCTRTCSPYISPRREPGEDKCSPTPKGYTVELIVKTPPVISVLRELVKASIFYWIFRDKVGRKNGPTDRSRSSGLVCAAFVPTQSFLWVTQL